MFAIAFDLIVAITEATHPKGVTQAYADIGNTLAKYGFTRVQGSLYITPDDNLANLFSAIDALKRLPWFAPCVRDIRAFKVEHWSDFTAFVKGEGNR
jgi:virulence-associated protein VapD